MTGIQVLELQPGRLVKVFAPGKVNLLLRVGATPPTEVRHELLTVFQCLDLGECLLMQPGSGTSGDTLKTELAPGLRAPANLDGPENLALRALQALRESGFELPATSVNITKHIPVAGGMAGGSADAAGVLAGANALYGLGLSVSQLQSIGSRLGSDVPYGFTGGNALGRGFGDRMESLPDGTKFAWVLAVYIHGLSTPAVFRAFDELHPHPEPLPATLPDSFLAALSQAPEDLAKVLQNDLQEAALKSLPELGDVIHTAEQAGALKAIVSGSGPTIAALCRDPKSQAEVAAALQKHPQVAMALPVNGPV